MNVPSHLPWHAQAWQRLAAARKAGRLPHAVLIRGAAGLGKVVFARRLAAALLCPTPLADGDACGKCPACRQRAAGSHPDLNWLNPEAEGKQIKIDAVRGLIARSVLAAQPDGYRVSVIEPADALNRAAANALLKTLEEPTPRTVLILVSSRPDRLPGTIRSRCQTVGFKPPPGEEAALWLQENGTVNAQVTDMQALLALSGGAPLRALQAAKEDWIGQDRDLCEDLGLLQRRESNPVQLLEKWEDRSLTAVTAGLKRLVADLVRLAAGLSDVALCHPTLRTELQSLVEGIDLRNLYRLADALTDADRSAVNNANIQMTMEHLANCWLQLTRPGDR